MGDTPQKERRIRELLEAGENHEGFGGISQQPDRESLGQRAPKSSNGLESLTALGFILSMAPRC